MKDKFLKNKRTGCIFRSTPALEKKTDMIPCADPREKPVETEPVPEVESNVTQEEGADLIKEWFDQGVGDVTIVDLKEFAQGKGIEIPGRLKKLELVTAIKKALTTEV
ncbi:MAG: hypothetical protein DRH26_00080 [Deltaproteobacteria bacterium]|nr:MAG: hypothetical protein DRH26_00080 [Deltaproteobacteria bacterium]